MVNRLSTILHLVKVFATGMADSKLLYFLQAGTVMESSARDVKPLEEKPKLSSASTLPFAHLGVEAWRRIGGAAVGRLVREHIFTSDSRFAAVN